MKAHVLLLFAVAALAGCETTSAQMGEDGTVDEVTIPADDVEPLVQFVLETRRVLLGEYVRIEASSQFFQNRMGFTRDFRYVERTSWVEPDGSQVIRLRNMNPQESNIAPELLPRVYFGQGLEIRALKEMRIHLTPARDREKPLFLDVVAKNSTGDAQLWVHGRLEKEQPSIRIGSALVWSEERERYVHRGTG